MTNDQTREPCSFCGRRLPQRYLCRGPGVRICQDCCNYAIAYFVQQGNVSTPVIEPGSMFALGTDHPGGGPQAAASGVTGRTDPPPP